MTKEENIKWLSKCLYGYSEGAFRERYKGILLTEQAMFKIGTVFGFLAAHEELIENFFNELEWMNNHELVEVGPNERCGYKYKVPNKITKMSDDGTLFGFGFIQMILVNAPTPHRTEQLGLFKDSYAYGMNGGLIFHGFGNNNLTVTLDGGQKWSIHT